MKPGEIPERGYAIDPRISFEITENDTCGFDILVNYAEMSAVTG